MLPEGPFGPNSNMDWKIEKSALHSRMQTSEFELAHVANLDLVSVEVDLLGGLHHIQLDGNRPKKGEVLEVGFQLYGVLLGDDIRG